MSARKCDAIRVVELRDNRGGIDYTTYQGVLYATPGWPRGKVLMRTGLCETREQANAELQASIDEIALHRTLYYGDHHA